jgi:hypothetical protein
MDVLNEFSFSFSNSCRHSLFLTQKADTKEYKAFILSLLIIICKSPKQLISLFINFILVAVLCLKSLDIILRLFRAKDKILNQYHYYYEDNQLNKLKLYLDLY